MDEVIDKYSTTKTELLQQIYKLKFIGPTIGTTSYTVQINPDSEKANKDICILPPTFYNWYRVDDTTSLGKDGYGPTSWEEGILWQNNSCALDVCINVALFLNVGSCSLDMLLPSEERKLTPAARMLKQLMQKEWVDAAVYKERIVERNKLFRELTEGTTGQTYNVQKSQYGFINISGVLDDLLAPFNQFKFTRYISKICCDGISTFVMRPKCSSKTQWNLKDTTKNLTLPQYLEKQMTNELDPCSKQCTNKTCCTKLSQQQLVIVDRPPPTLMIERNDQLKLSIEMENQIQMFCDMELTFFVHEAESLNVHYELLAVIFHTGETSWQHYVLRVKKHTNEIYHLDGMKGTGKAIQVKDWWGEYGIEKGKARPSVAFFRRV